MKNKLLWVQTIICNYILISLCTSLQAQTAIPGTALLSPANRPSGITWIETITDSRYAGLGVNHYTYTTTVKDREGNDMYSYNTGSLVPFAQGKTTKLSVCYCDGTPVFVIVESKDGAVIFDSRSSVTGHVPEQYKDKVRELCYPRVRPTATLALKQNADSLYREVITKKDLSHDNKLNLLNRAIDYSETDGRLHYEKGRLLYLKGLYLDAAISFQNAIVTQYRADSSYYYKGRSLHFLGQFKQAAITLTEAAKRLPEMPMAWFYQGESFMDDGAYADAFYAFTRFRTLMPDTRSEEGYKAETQLMFIRKEIYRLK